MQTKGPTKKFEAWLSDEQRCYIVEVRDGRPVTHEDMEDSRKRIALESAARSGIIDPDDQRLEIHEERREWLRQCAGKPTRWESEPESRPPWLRAVGRERAEARRRYAMASLGRRREARTGVRVRCRAFRARERRPRCHSRRQAGATRAGPDDGAGDPPPHPPARASLAGEQHS